MLRSLRLCVSVAGHLALVVLTATVARAADAPSPKPLDAFARIGHRVFGQNRTYTPFYGNVIAPHAVVEKGIVYCAFQNTEGRPIVMAYDPAKKAWAGPVKASEHGLGGDAHGNPSICIDRRGYLHVFCGCHGRAMRHTRSARPLDFTEWVEQEPPTPQATYPQSMRMADRSLCLFYRAGGHKEPWQLRISRDDGKTWSDAESVIEMRRDPPDRQAAAYCMFFPGVERRTVHCFWHHKDDNAARVTKDTPHPWRPLKYPGLHEAVYRYNVYYIRRDAGGTWRNAKDDTVNLPVSKREADTRCLVLDSGHEFTSLSRMALYADNRPYLRMAIGVADWARHPKKVLVPYLTRYVRLADGKWDIREALPGDWPDNARGLLSARGLWAWGEGYPGPWFIFCRNEREKPHAGGYVFLYHGDTGYAARADGPAVCE